MLKHELAARGATNQTSSHAMTNRKFSSEEKAVEYPVLHSRVGKLLWGGCVFENYEPKVYSVLECNHNGGNRVLFPPQ